ncbi:hypothetical protein LQZ19_11375 [Treponema primitia]|uniref:hypothetical protein n=1 Tax=Treponema primitia TaxID=88058 RepID=UPI0039809EBE
MIIERIKRRIDPNMFITPQTTPIVFFGNYDKSKVCTISLNPSDKEFIDNSNDLLDFKNNERLCSRKKLRRNDNEELTDDEANAVLKYCNEYFKVHPYKGWFDPLDYFIKHFGNYSYYDDTCVHLDLVQWATTPKWNDVPQNIRQRHLNNDLPVLKYLLNKDFEVMFLNGKTVVDNVAQCLDLNIKSKNTVFKNSNGKESELYIYYGEYNSIKIVGWNLYLQSAAVGGYENKSILCKIIKGNL